MYVIMLTQKRVLKMILLMIHMMVEKNKKKRALSPIEEREMCL